MGQFNVGDVVRCRSNRWASQLMVGGVYTVVGKVNGLIKLGGNAGRWCPTRFELAAPSATTGESRKARGQAAAARRAGSEWASRAIVALKRFCLDKYASGSTRVTLDEFRAAGRVDEPESANAWGSLPRTAARLGFLRDTGHTEKAGREKAHARLVKVWAIQPRAL